MGLDRAIDITVGQRKAVLALLERQLPNTTVWVYGSRAKWTARPQSDLDMVVFATPEQASRVSNLREAFEESNLPFRVDLFVWDAVPERFRKQIEAEHVVLRSIQMSRAQEREVSSQWQEVRWGDLATLEYGRALRGYDTARGPFRVFGTNGPIGWHDEALCSHPSVIVGRKGAYRGIHYSSKPFFAIDTAFYLKPRREMDVRWAYYQLLTQDINGMDSGSVIPSTSRDEFYSLPLLLPPLPEQRAIAHILGTLDDKIELNQRMNETLEAMARALFKSWFVDFDPVRSKMEGRDPGLPKHIADFFPDRLVDSELGEIPEGWEVTPLSECIEVVRGLSYKGSRLSSDGVPMHNLNSIYEGGGYKHEGLKGYDGEHKSQHIARAGDLIVANTEQGHDRLLIGYAAIVPTYFVDETLFSHHIYRVRPKDCMVLTSNYLCQLLNLRSMHEIVSGFANGTTVNMLPMDALQIPQLVVPARRVLAAFNDLAEAARRRQEEMSDESRTLAALRDALLPNLTSGELWVRGATRFTGRTTSVC